jgi:hypothetical protein
VGGTVGVSPVAGAIGGVPYRPAGRESAWVVVPETTRVDWMLRAAYGSPRPCRVEIEVDRRLAAVLDLNDTTWEPVRLALPPPGVPRPSRRIDVRARTSGCLVFAGPMTVQ